MLEASEEERETADLAKEQSIVDNVVPEAELLSRAIEKAAGLASKASPALHQLKAGMYPRALAGR